MYLNFFSLNNSIALLIVPKKRGNFFQRFLKFKLFLELLRVINKPLSPQVHELPDHHFQTLKFILKHLKRVVDNAEVNKMEARNLAIVFGPTLVRAGDDNMITMVRTLREMYLL